MTEVNVPMVRWDDFKVFNDTLDAGILQHSPEGLSADILKFYHWLQEVVASPTSHGVPIPHIANVTNLFNKFLIHTPSENPQSSTKGSVSLITVRERSNAKGDTEIDPVDVTFGPNHAVLKIADGATALGYLFSLIEPPSNADWQNYWFPLCLVFSRCIYLAFVKDYSSQSLKISGVPVMVNVMYLVRHTQQFAVSSRPFMFGAAIPSKPYHKDASIKKLQDQTRNRAAKFRRGEVLFEELREHSSAAALPLDESEVWSLCLRLHQLITGVVKVRDTKVESIFTELAKGASLRQEKAFERSGKVFWVPILPKLLAIREPTKVLLRPKLEVLIRHRWSMIGTASSIELDANFAAMIQDLLKFYITPHILSKTTMDVAFSLNEDELGSAQESLESWWQNGDNRAAAYAKVQFLVDQFDKHHDPPSMTRSGFCAETYPSFGVQSKFFPASIGQTHNIRGLAMEPRGIGNTNYFNIHGISLSTVRQIPGRNGHTQEMDEDRHVCRYPCRNCEKLLPKFGIAAQRTGVPPRSDYDKDMEEARVNAQ